MNNTAAEFNKHVNVSRETMDRLNAYEALLNKWNSAINLVSRSTLKDAWSRHFLDSAQLFDMAPKGFRHWADLGAGGGFPGLVIAVIAAEKAPEAQISLVESDLRKATFLRTAGRTLKLEVNVISTRIEEAMPLSADILSARALAPLDKLLGFASQHLAPDGICLFSKGEKAQEEVDHARASWRFDIETFSSKTESRAKILKIGAINRV